MRNKSSRKVTKKKDELPSFLLNVQDAPEGADIPPRNKKSAPYLGPIFFGECLQFHSPHHSVPLSSFHHVPFSLPSKENVLKDMFLPKVADVKTYYESRTFHPAIRTQKVFVDLFTHKCPGVRRIFAPDPSLSESLGETKSIIEGETAREIPFFRVKNVTPTCGSLSSKPQFEIVTLSDIREEKRSCMSYKERMAHAHFPKEFVTVRVIGPTIPEAITITKLPSKRKTSFELDLHLKSKRTDKNQEEDKGSLNEATAVVEKEKEESKESVLSLLKITEPNVEERPDTNSEGEKCEEIEDESERQQSVVISGSANDEEQEEETEALEEDIGEEGAENFQVFIDNEKEDFLEAEQEENQNEAVED